MEVIRNEYELSCVVCERYDHLALVRLADCQELACADCIREALAKLEEAQ